MQCHKCFLLGLFLLAAPVFVAAKQFSEHEIMAVYIYKLTRFIYWENNSEKRLNICFFGESNKNIVSTFKSLIKKNDDKYSVNTSPKIKDLTSCNLLFIGNDAQASLDDILAVIDGNYIVTISDIPSFAVRGGMFSLKLNNNKIQVELNITNAKKQDIRINSDLSNMINLIE